MKVRLFDPLGPEADRFAKLLEECGGGLYQSPRWCAAKAADGWAPVGLLAEDGRDARGGLIALARKLPAGLSRLAGLWHVPRGPVARYDDEAGREAAAALLDALERLARSRGGAVIRMSPDAEAGVIPDGWLAAQGYHPAEGAPWMHTATFRVDLARPEEAILAGMEGRTRSAIRKAAAAGVVIDGGNGPDAFACFYAMHRATGERNAFGVISERRMEALWRRSGEEGWGKIFLSRAPDGAPLTGALVLAPGRRCHYLFGASLPGRRRWHPNELLHWEVMRWARRRGCDLYDLEGVAGRVRPGHPLWGNYLFKRGFGGRYVELAGEHERVLRPRTHRLLSWTIERLRGARLRGPKTPAAEPAGGRDA